MACAKQLHCQLIGCYRVAGYIGEFEIVDDHRGGKIVVELNGRYASALPLSKRCSCGVRVGAAAQLTTPCSSKCLVLYLRCRPVLCCSLLVWHPCLYL